MRKTMIRIFAFAVALVLSLSVAMTALAAYDTIPYGEQSNDVRRMQTKLKEKGFYRGKVDGEFGPATKAAVIKYQSSIGITADGKPGNKTLTALYKGASAINGANNTAQYQLIDPKNPHTLFYGCTGSRVKSLQRALKAAGVYKGAIDGVFGDLTRDAVIKYQRKKGLSADGLAGPKTLNSLKRSTGVSISSGFVLSRGSKGYTVLGLKRYLARQGYWVPSGDVFDAELEQIVRRWQADTGREVNGAVTEAEYNALMIG